MDRRLNPALYKKPGADDGLWEHLLHWSKFIGDDVWEQPDERIAFIIKRRLPEEIRASDEVLYRLIGILRKKRNEPKPPLRGRTYGTGSDTADEPPF